MDCGDFKRALTNIYVPANNPTTRKRWLEAFDWKQQEQWNATIGGDWNIVTEAGDKHSTKREWIDEVDSRFLRGKMKELSLIDCWKWKGTPKDPGHTFTHRSNHATTRIDKWLVPIGFVANVKKMEVKHENHLSDHRPLLLHWDFEKIKFGPGFWKLNNSLLTDPEVKKDLLAMWNMAKANRFQVVGSGAEWWLQFTASVMEYLKEIGKDRAEKRNLEMVELQRQLAALSIEFQSNKDISISSKIEQLETQILNLELYKLEGERIRARVFEVEKAERPTKFFFVRAQRRKTRTLIRKLKVTNNTVATGHALLEVVERFYTKLYEKKKTRLIAQQKLLCNIRKQFTSSTSQKLGKKVMLEELEDATAMLKKGKSPGSTGLTAEFYQLCPFVLEGLLWVWEDILESGAIPSTFSNGVISLVYKKNDHESLGNYRPITLLNLDYKIIAKVYAERLKKEIASVVGKNQRGFIPGRDIRANIIEARLALDIAKQRKMDGAMLLFDFEKAFDRLDRSYLYQILDRMRCGSNFITAIKRMHTGNHATVLVNGYPTNWFEVVSGVRQGCPIAPLLYAISTEPLRGMVEHDSTISGLVIDNIRLKIQMYADDTNGFASSATDVKRILELFRLHEEASGALLNLDKCSAIIIGGLKESDLGQIKPLKGDQFEWLLGVPFGPKNHDDKALKRVQEKFDDKLRIWQDWPLTIFGRATVGNTSVLSHIWRASQFIPDIPVWEPGRVKPKSTWQPFHKAYWKYVQSGNFNGVFNYFVAAKKKREGGIGAIQPIVEIEALKAHWMVRMLDSNNKDDSWTRLMWLQFDNVAKKYRVKDPRNFSSWDRTVIKVGSLMEDIIRCWLLCKVELVDGENGIEWLASDGSQQKLNTLSVKILYNNLKSHYQRKNQTDGKAKNRNWAGITDEEWLEHWKFLADAKHLTPRDQQVRFRIQQSKLWAGINRAGYKCPPPKCPICGVQENKTNHPVSLECGLASAVFNALDQKWLEWTNTHINKLDWELDWVSKSTPHQDQLDLMLTTAKRILYYNYTQILHDSPEMDWMELMAKLFGSLRYRIKATIWICNRSRDKRMNGWDLQGNWALLDIESNKWEAVEDSFSLLQG